MNDFHFDDIAGDTLATPFEPTRQEVSLSHDLQTDVATLFPAKSLYYLQNTPGLFSVTLVPDTPEHEWYTSQMTPEEREKITEYWERGDVCPLI